MEAQDGPGSSANATASGRKGKISVSGAFALYPLMVTWADEFQKINPGVKIEVSAGERVKACRMCSADW